MRALDLWGRDKRRSPSLDSDLDPISDFDSMFREMDRLLAPFRSSISTDLGVSPPCDITESESDFVLHFDLPGIDKDDVNIEVQNNQLMLSGERKREFESADGSRRIVERRFGEFRRSFTLPEGTDTDKIEANYRNGVLQLSIPKSESVKAKRIAIQEGKGGGFLKRINRSIKTDDDDTKASHDESSRT